MALIIELDPETEERLDRAAAAHGIKVEEYARRVLEENTPQASSTFETRTPEQRVQALHDWLASHDKYSNVPVPPDEALDRESIYAGRGD